MVYLIRALTVFAVLTAIALPGAHAELAWHAGVELRVDSAAHPIRIGGGVDRGVVDLGLTLDPMFWTDGQIDTDLRSAWKVSCSRWRLLAGWRTTAIGILGGHQYQEKPFVGVTAPLPDLGRVHGHWGFELAIVVVKHGGGLPTDGISFASGRDFIDLVNFGMFATFEVGHAR